MNTQGENDRIAYTPAEAARLAGFSRNGLYKHLASGDLRSFKIGSKKRLIYRADLLAFLDTMANPAVVDQKECA